MSPLAESIVQFLLVSGILFAALRIIWNSVLYPLALSMLGSYRVSVLRNIILTVVRAVEENSRLKYMTSEQKYHEALASAKQFLHAIGMEGLADSVLLDKLIQGVVNELYNSEREPKLPETNP